MPRVSLIVPAYNEARRLPRLVDELRSRAAAELEAAGLNLAEAIVVDDGSVDGTGELLRAATSDVPAIVARSHGGPALGKGAALALGASDATGDLVLFTDVDLAAPLGEAAKLRAALDGGADIAIGSRAIDRSRLTGIPLRRRLMARLCNRLVSRAQRSALPRHAVRVQAHGGRRGAIAVRPAVTPGFAFDVELLMRARAGGLRVAEVPIAYHHDANSRIAANRAALGMARDVARLAWRMRVPRRYESA